MIFSFSKTNRQQSHYLLFPMTALEEGGHSMPWSELENHLTCPGRRLEGSRNAWLLPTILPVVLCSGFTCSCSSEIQMFLLCQDPSESPLGILSEAIWHQIKQRSCYLFPILLCVVGMYYWWTYESNCWLIRLLSLRGWEQGLQWSTGSQELDIREPL